MDDFNSLVQIINNSMPVVRSSISALVGGFISAMFLRGNTSRAEFEKIKAGKINEALEDLLSNRELTLTEMLKCKNMLEIAQKADTIYSKAEKNNDQNEKKEFEFDWFLRFFEAAGSISNKDMQMLYAQILKGEIENPGRTSFRTLELLRNMTADEADLFTYCARVHVCSPFREVFLLNSDEAWSSFDFENEQENMRHEVENMQVSEESDLFTILSLAYKINHDEISILEQCGVLSSILVNSTFEIDNQDVFISNKVGVISLKLKNINDKPQTFILKGFRFTRSAVELFEILDKPPKLEYILDLARLIEYKYPAIEVRAYKVLEIYDDGSIAFDDEMDMLHSDDYNYLTQLPNISKLDKEFRLGHSCRWD